MGDLTQAFAERIRAASADGQALRLRGGGSKDFYGLALAGEILDTRSHSGIVSYAPSELVMTARSGTPLAEIEAVLAREGQMLGFEPPHFGEDATLGGCIAAGLSGPRRATAGAVRDFVLGIQLLDGTGRTLNFGGQVMKNVAGFDISRMMAGSLGTLGLILEASFKVLPKPVVETTVRIEMPQARALEHLNGWAGKPLPISASCWLDEVLCVRLSGARSAVGETCAQLGGEVVDVEEAAACWHAWREQRAAFFADDLPLWRISLPSVAPPLDLRGEQLIEWGGSLRWFKSGEDAQRIRSVALQAGGHATLFRAPDEQKQCCGVFQPLTPALLALHHQIKQTFDPQGIFNPGRMYPIESTP